MTEPSTDRPGQSAPSTEVRFHRVARSGQVPEGYVRRFYVDELECALARLNGKAYATSNYCTHLDCLLSSGKLVDDGLGCSCHGSVFDLETGYPVKEEDGQVYVGVSEADIVSGGPRRRKPRAD